MQWSYLAQPYTSLSPRTGLAAYLFDPERHTWASFVILTLYHPPGKTIMLKPIVLSVLMLGLAAPVWAQSAPAAAACPALLDQRFNRLQDDAPQNLCQYAGSAVLVVNTASYCGYTSQYQGLEDLYAKYGSKGLVILGFPSNDFSQEPGNAKQIAELCFNTYGVKFPMFAKSSVAGASANPMFTALAKASGTPPKWNFHKYLIDRSGNVVGNYPSKVTPGDPRLVADIEKALAKAR